MRDEDASRFRERYTDAGEETAEFELASESQNPHGPDISSPFQSILRTPPWIMLDGMYSLPDFPALPRASVYGIDNDPITITI